MKQIIHSDPIMEMNDNLLQSITGITHIIAAYLIATTNNFEAFSNARKYTSY